MATRKFHDIEYPVPGVDTAIKILRPNARYAFTNLRDDDCFDVESSYCRFICQAR